MTTYPYRIKMHPLANPADRGFQYKFMAHLTLWIARHLVDGLEQATVVKVG